MSHGRYGLSQRQWELIRDELPQPLVRADGKSRPSRSDRELLNGVFWILCSGMPAKYEPWQTVYDRFRKWQQLGVFERVLRGCFKMSCRGVKVVPTLVKKVIRPTIQNLGGHHSKEAKKKALSK